MKIIITEQQIKKILNEGTNRGEVYHYTYGIKDILQTNTINLSSNLGTDADKYGDKFFFLSLSRTPGVNIGYGKYHRSRLVLDGNKLNQNFKSIPVDYWGDKRGDVDRSEYEDRIITDKPQIKDFNKYIIRIEIVDENPKSKRNFDLLQLAKEKNIPIFFYLNKNDLLRKRNNVNDEVENTFGPHEKEYVSYPSNYISELTKILSIILYKDNILDNEELLDKNIQKIKQEYKLPNIKTYDVMELMRNMAHSEWRMADVITSLKTDFHNYFKSGKGDEFRNWIKLLTNEMKKNKVSNLNDLVNLKFNGIKPKQKFVDYSKDYFLFYNRNDVWEKEENDIHLDDMSLYFRPMKYGGVLNDVDTNKFYEMKNNNLTVGDWLNYLLNKYTLEKVKKMVHISGYREYNNTYEYKLDKNENNN